MEKKNVIFFLKFKEKKKNRRRRLIYLVKLLRCLYVRNQQRKDREN